MEHVMEEPRTRITARVSDKVRVTLEQAAGLFLSQSLPGKVRVPASGRSEEAAA